MHNGLKVRLRPGKPEKPIFHHQFSLKGTVSRTSSFFFESEHLENCQKIAIERDYLALNFSYLFGLRKISKLQMLPPPFKLDAVK